MKILSRSCLLWAVGLLLLPLSASAQSGIIRGNVLEQSSGEPVMFTNVYLQGTQYGTLTDDQGFYSISGVPAGSYTLVSTTIGYDTAMVEITVTSGQILNQNLFLNATSYQLGPVNVDAERAEKATEVQISTVKATPADIRRLPSVGGEPDLAQYIQVLPGVITTGDQGGQLFIRGGAPVHNKILLDGMDIYNGFHSIGLFSVYETEVIRDVEVMTGGFNAQYGGRISAVIDVDTRDGNKTRFSGLVSANPFVSKFLVEGPIKKLDEEGNSISYLITGKHSYLNETAEVLYGYAEQEDVQDRILPYNFTDFFGKVSLVGSSGSRLNVTAFNYNDFVDYSPVASYNWDAFGAGASFRIVPGQSKTVINGHLNYSDYRIELQEEDQQPRFSSIGGFNLGMNFLYFLENNSEVRYGVDISGFSTEFEFFNNLGLRVDQNQNTTELGGFIVYKKVTDKWVIEPSLRLQYYASLGNFSPEPRLGTKFKATENLRFKFAGGLYSQNLISSKSDRDVVNLFTGFLSGPEERLNDINGEQASHKLQKAIHAITGVEYDLTENLMVSVEPYAKWFTQLINLNRNKISSRDPNYMIEEGRAVGIDFLVSYETERVYLWTTYSLGYVTRNDGTQIYPPHYDRRHNVNILASYRFGANNQWEASARWNLGSGFPFTRTQGFYEQIIFDEGVSTDYTTANGDLGIIYDNELNTGRLPYYHRLDISLQREFKLGQYSSLRAVASVLNVYNRNNIFYFDRVRYERVNQLPILPSIGLTLSF